MPIRIGSSPRLDSFIPLHRGVNVSDQWDESRAKIDDLKSVGRILGSSLPPGRPVFPHPLGLLGALGGAKRSAAFLSWRRNTWSGYNHGILGGPPAPFDRTL